MTDLDELERLAREAIPGPWRHDRFGTVMATTHPDAVTLPGGVPIEAQVAQATGQAAMHGAPDRGVAELRDATAAYIAAASPDVILDLIARVRAAEGQLRDIRDQEARDAEEAEALSQISAAIREGTRRSVNSMLVEAGLPPLGTRDD